MIIIFLGAHYLSKRLKSMKSLRILNLSYNEIRIDGALEVCKGKIYHMFTRIPPLYTAEP